MERILIVEDSHTFSALLTRRVKEAFDCEVVTAASYEEAVDVFESGNAEFLAALLDVNLPDAPNGEVVGLVAQKGIPSIVFTGELDDALREAIWSKRIADYVFKDRIESVDYIIELVRSIRTNKDIFILAVDDSKTSRRLLAELLRVRRYTVLEAENGVEALKMLAEHPEIMLVVTDYNMPEMDGFELTREIRRSRSKEELPIIGISAEQSSWVSARFIKQGANDYVNKPFSSEEFYCRIAQNIEMLQYINRIKEMANTDFMTGAYNRKYFFEVGAKLYARMSRGGPRLVVAMMDIDFFKKVNDEFGHDAGDEVIKRLASRLRERFRESDVVARFGGEEFCVLATGMDDTCDIEGIFESIRADIEAGSVRVGDKDIRFTVSVGACCEPKTSLEEMVKEADEMLYQSKNTGRNKVTIHRSCGFCHAPKP